MDDKKDQPEPTMEEILASIRRIISEDAQEEGEGKASEDDPAAVEEEPVTEPAEAPAEEPADDIFELTEVAEQPEPDDIGIPETAPDDLAVPELEPAIEPEPEFEPEPEPAFEPEPAAADEPEPFAAADEPPQDEEAIVSPAPAAATTAAFAGLMGALNRPPAVGGDMPIGNSGLTLEDLVRETIRPMLREWLDANLPPLVERLVKREIERMVRRAED